MTDERVLRAEIVRAARAWLGTPYTHQASVRGVGCDCLGLIRGVWRDVFAVEAEIPPGYSRDWAEARGDEPLLEAAARHLDPVGAGCEEPGDVLIFRYRDHIPAKHCAILSQHSTMIHAFEGTGVIEVPIGSWWGRRIAGRFRVRAPRPVTV